MQQDAEQTVWYQFGVTGSPFDHPLENAPDYPAEQWDAHIHSLQGFRAGRHPLCLLTGIGGSGKTTLIKQFLHRQDDAVRIHEVVAQSHITLSHLLQALDMRQAGDRPIGVNLPDIFARLRELVEQFGAQLLFIDDAQLLSREALFRLLHLLFEQPEDNLQLRVVLAGEPQLKDRVMGMLDEIAPGRELPSFEITPLSATETAAYLEHRLRHAGMTTQLPFTNAMIQQVHELSRGYPGRINRVAQQVLLDSTKFHPTQQGTVGMFKDFLMENKVKLSSIFLLFLSIFALWQLQPQPKQPKVAHNTVVKPTHIGNPQTNIIQADTRSTTTVRDAVIAAMENYQATQLDSDDERYYTQALAPKAHFASTKQQTEPTATVKLAQAAPMFANLPVKIAMSAMQPAITDITAFKSKPATAATKHDQHAAIRAHATKPAPTKMAQADTHHIKKIATKPMAKNHAKPITQLAAKISSVSLTQAEQRLMNLSNAYTLQLVSASSPAGLKAFARKHKLNDALFFRTVRNGKDWYVLVYSIFETQEAAQAAVDTLPAKLQAAKPWVRSINSIHRSIRLAKHHSARSTQLARR